MGVSINRIMSKPVKYNYYAVTLYGNVVVNMILSRHLHKWFYKTLVAKIEKNTVIYRIVDVLSPKSLDLYDNVTKGAVATKLITLFVVCGDMLAKCIMRRNPEIIYHVLGVPLLHRGLL